MLMKAFSTECNTLSATLFHGVRVVKIEKYACSKYGWSLHTTSNYYVQSYVWNVRRNITIM